MQAGGHPARHPVPPPGPQVASTRPRGLAAWLPPAAFAALLPGTLLAQEKVTYDDHVLPVFQQACLNCHNPDKTKGGLDLSSFAGTLKGGSGGTIVEPGDPGSKLLAVVQHAAEPKMPPEGDKLAADKIAVLKSWIDGGLLQSKSSSARKPSKPKINVALRSDPAAKPDGPPPMPQHLLLDPPVVTPRASPVRAIAASPWAPLLAVAGQRQVLLHHADSLELLGILPFPEGDPVSLAFSPDARHLIVGGGTPGKSGLTVTFDATNGQRVLTAAKEFDTVLAADLSPDFSSVATGSPSRLLKFWDTQSGAARKSVKKHTDWITALDISPDGILCASGDRNGGVWVWETGSGNEFHTLRAHQAAITALAFRADSNLLASASLDGTVRFWEMNGGTEVRKNDAHPGGVTAFCFARDGASLTTGRDMKVKWWKPDFSHARDLAQGLPSLPTAAAVDAEGKRAFVGCYDGIVRAYDTATSRVAGEFTSAPPTIESRLRTLAEQIRVHPQAVAGAEAKAAAAERKATGDKDPAAAKELAEARAALESAKSQLGTLQAAERRWQAAAIRAEAIKTGEEAARLDETHEELAAGFAQAAKAIEGQASATAAAFRRRDSFAAKLAAPAPDPALADELRSVVDTLDHLAAREQAKLRERTRDLTELRRQVDDLAPRRVAAAARAAELDARYHACSGGL